MNKINRIGLEAEFFLTNSKGELVYPQGFGFDYDDFIILGEFRAEPGSTREDTIANFIKELVRVRLKAQQKKLTLSYGYKEITPKFKREILKKMGTKEIQDTKNIYNTEILSCSDDVVEDGKIVSSKISAGLHIHFSKEVVFERNIQYTFEHNTQSTLVRENYYILRPSDIKGIITAMDKYIYPKYTLPVKLKYRQVGFYELKPYGFEYRSLPMCNEFTSLVELEEVVDYAFTLLENLDK